MADAPLHRMTYDEYLAFERASDTKHEFVDGQIYGMSGGTYEHSLLAGNVIGLLFNALRGGSCVALTSDMRVRAAADIAAYPDVTVVCGERRFSTDTRDELLNPTLLVEVMSPSSEAYDRGDKFLHYKTIESLREYVLVSTSGKNIDVFTRQGEGAWLLRSYAAGETVILASIDARLPVDDIYAGAELTPRQPVLRRAAIFRTSVGATPG